MFSWAFIKVRIIIIHKQHKYLLINKVPGVIPLSHSHIAVTPIQIVNAVKALIIKPHRD